MTCKAGCRTDDHCPKGQLCDTRRFQCARDCSDDSVDCGHFACVKVGGHSVCGSCDATHCDCAIGRWGDCNLNPGDGCETKLDTATNCGACGRPASNTCLVDADHDGYGVEGSDTILCTCTDGYVVPPGYLSFDCDDSDFDVHPYAWGSNLEDPVHGWDYNCDGTIDKYVNPDPITDSRCDMFSDCAPTATDADCGQPVTETYCTVNADSQCEIVTAMGLEFCK
jgi:hypothetical protein